MALAIKTPGWRRVIDRAVRTARRLLARPTEAELREQEKERRKGILRRLRGLGT
jgi:hypothetical protein